MSKNKQTKWIQLTLYKNCFNDDEKQHIGFKHDGIYYCLTHTRSSVLIPKNCLRMNHLSDKKEYITLAVSLPVVVNLTNMRISKLFFYNQFLKKKKCQEPLKKSTQNERQFQRTAEIQAENVFIS